MGTVLSGPQALSPSTNQMLGMNPNGDLRADHMVVSGASGSATVTQAHICGNHITVNPTTATDTVLVTAVSGKIVYVCDYNFSSNGSNNINLETSAGTAIDTVWYTVVNSAKTDANPYYRGLNTGASQASP